MCGLEIFVAMDVFSSWTLWGFSWSIHPLWICIGYSLSWSHLLLLLSPLLGPKGAGLCFLAPHPSVMGFSVYLSRFPALATESIFLLSCSKEISVFVSLPYPFSRITSLKIAQRCLEIKVQGWGVFLLGSNGSETSSTGGRCWTSRIHRCLQVASNSVGILLVIMFFFQQWESKQHVTMMMGDSWSSSWDPRPWHLCSDNSIFTSPTQIFCLQSETSNRCQTLPGTQWMLHKMLVLPVSKLPWTCPQSLRSSVNACSNFLSSVLTSSPSSSQGRNVATLHCITRLAILITCHSHLCRLTIISFLDYWCKSLPTLNLFSMHQ